MAYACALSAVLIWSTVASAFKLTLRELTPTELMFYSVAMSAATLLAVLAASGRLRDLVSCSRREYAMSAAAGLLNPFLYYAVLFEAYDRLPAQEAQPINFTWSVLLVLLSIPFLHQRIRPISVVAILVSYAGVLVIATRGDVLGMELTDPTGVALMLLSTIIWSIFWILNLSDGREGATKLALAFLFGLVPVTVWAAATGALGPGAAPPPAAGLAGAAYVGVFEMGITFVLWLRALSLSRDTSQVTILIFIAPFVSLVLIHFLVGETILMSSIAGLALIVVGILVQKWEELFSREGRPRAGAAPK